MIVQKDFLNRLKDFGLNSYEAKLWTALLSRGVATAGELSDIANVPRSRTYDVLESLERKGFVVMKLGKPIKYLAINPAEVIERVKKRIKEEAEKQSDVIDTLRKSEVLGELESLHKHGINLIDPSEFTGVVKGRGNLTSHLASLIKNAEKNVSIMTTEQGVLRKQESLRSALAKAKENGVKIRVLAPLTKQNQEAAKALSKSAQVKHSNELVSRFCIVDGKHLTLMALDETLHPNYDFGVWINSEHFAKNFEGIFNHVWERSK